MSGEHERLKDLFFCTDAACNAFYQEEDAKSELINWGDFGCVSAEFFFSEEGSGTRVTIEEASPNCQKAHAFICAHLVKNGWENVQVIIQW